MESEERQLSDRERTVLLLAAEGLTDKAIARHLDLSQRTIGTYWERMRQKLGHYSRTQLVARFLRMESEAVPETQRYRSLFATWEEGAWILSCTGRTIYANSRIADLFGLGVEEFESADAGRLLENASSTTLGRLMEAAQSGPHEIEFNLRRPNADSLWLKLRATMTKNARGECAALVLLLHDVTVQRRVQYTLDTCAATLDFVMRHSSDLMARFDADGRCVEMNPSLLRLANRDAESVVGLSVEDLAGVFEPNVRWRAHLDEAIRSGEPQAFDSTIATLSSAEMRTHLLPVPAENRQVGHVLSMTVPRLASPMRK